MASRQEALQPHIVEVIDHHKDEEMYPSTAALNISQVSPSLVKKGRLGPCSCTCSVYECIHLDRANAVSEAVLALRAKLCVHRPEYATS